ncbi:MAG TPA: hypothetical protein VGJ38_02000 [Jatrophihabitantaceae bacterium]
MSSLRIAAASTCRATRPGVPDHLRDDDEAPDFDVSRDPTPGVPDHAAPDDDED